MSSRAEWRSAAGVPDVAASARAPHGPTPAHAASSRRHHGLAAWVCLLALGLAVPALAAAPVKRPPLAQSLRGEALERYEAARLEFKAQRFAPALAAFLRAHELSKDVRLLWNAAACQRRLERNADALKSLDAYLADGATDLTPEELEEAKKAQAAVRERVATVHLAVTPPDTAVTLDGSPLLFGADSTVTVDPGRHAFHFSRPGYQERLRQDALAAGDAARWTIELALVPTAPDAPASPVLTRPAPPPAPAPTPAPPAPRRWAPWAVGGAGLVTAAVGGLLVGGAAGDYTRLRSSCRTMCAPKDWQPARDRETAGVALLGVGAAAAAGGLVWWLLAPADAPVRVSASLGQVVVEGRF